MTFGDYLRELRQARGITKQKLAALLSAPFSTVDAWERRGTTPHKASLAAVIEKLELSNTEKKKLTELWMAMPSRSRREAARAEAAAELEPKEAATARRDALDGLLARALVPARHTLSDGLAVLGALGEASDLISSMGLSEAAARLWLDAAAALRERGVKKVTGALLAVSMAELASRPKRNEAQRRVEEACETQDK